MRVVPREENITETHICRSLFNSQQPQRRNKRERERGGGAKKRKKKKNTTIKSRNDRVRESAVKIDPFYRVRVHRIFAHRCMTG